jgi:hypothetical protein
MGSKHLAVMSLALVSHHDTSISICVTNRATMMMLASRASYRCQDLTAVADDNAAWRQVAEIGDDIVPATCSRRKENALYPGRNPDGGQILRSGAPVGGEAPIYGLFQLGRQSRGQIQIALGGYTNYVSHPRVISEVDLPPSAQCRLSYHHVMEGSLLFDACVDGRHTDWHNTPAVEPCTFSADDAVGMKVSECD